MSLARVVAPPSGVRPFNTKLLWSMFALTLFWALSGLLIPAVGFLARESDGKVLSSIDISDLMSGKLGLQALLYLFGFVAVYLVFSWLIWAVAQVVGSRLEFGRRKNVLFSLALWLFVISWVQLWNARAFPRSKVKYFDQDFALSEAGGWLFYLQGAVIVLLLLYAAAIFLPRRNWRWGGSIATLSIFVGVTVAFVTYDNQASHLGPKRPNVILIGIDSLRVDRVARAQGASVLTPNIDRFIKRSSLFQKAYTPLARTYPSWMSVLTGQFPKTNGVRYNLTATSSAARKSSIAWMFRSLGYETMLAMDERRFANIDAKHGFTTEVGPRIGAGDFLLASINDSPVTNLLMETAVGEHLFSFNHLNRAVDRLYYPERFDDELSAKLESRSTGRPLFLVSHFCMAHWPYHWAQLSKTSANGEEAQIVNYDKAVAQADVQFGRLMETLEREGLLDNAIVVLISDHGESLGESLEGEGDSALSLLLTRAEWGHGTNVFRDEQYRTVLAVRGYGDYDWIAASTIEAPVSLVDIAPTLFDVLRIDAQDRATKFDGVSLRAQLAGDEAVLPARPLFLESGFSVPAILTVNPSLEDAFRQGFQHYRVNATDGRLLVKASSHRQILSSKQRAVIYDGWQLGAINSEEDGEVHYGLRRLSDDRWSVRLDGELAKEAPVAELRKFLFDHYGEELEATGSAHVATVGPPTVETVHPQRQLAQAPSR